MDKIDTNINKIINKIKSQTGNSPDVIIKELTLKDTNIAVVFSEPLTDRIIINDYILEYFETIKLSGIEIPNLFKYIFENITTHKVSKVKSYKDLFYNLFSGFTLIILNGSDTIISIETRAQLDSGIAEASNEKVTKGPKDAFTENYQTNIGLIKKRLRTETLWLEEYTIGNKSNTKVGILYIKDIASKKLVEAIVKKIKNINIDGVFDSNYIIDTISDNKDKTFPNYYSTERPDQINMHLLEGRIAIVVENTPYVITLPTTFIDFFHSPEDFYQKKANVNFTRIIRLIAFIFTILTPAIYIAISTYNIEAIPTNLLLSFSSHREGLPLPTVVEIILMMITFEILKETDTRSPSAIGSSLSIVGALVLGQAAVAAGIASPITIIVVAVTAISGLISYSIDVINGARWWRLIFIILASVAGLYGVLIAGLIFLINICSIKSFGIPYLTPIAPFLNREQDNVLLTNKKKFNKRSQLTAKDNIQRQVKKQ